MPAEPLAVAAPEPPPVDLSPDTVNAAAFDGSPIPEGRSAIVLKVQVLLDRAGFSPGVIDGVMGDNVAKAIVAAEFVTGLPQDGVLDADVWNVLLPLAAEPVLVGYRITAEDLAGPFVPDLPSDYAALAKLPKSAYRTAERNVRRTLPHGRGSAPRAEQGRRLRGSRHGDRRHGGGATESRIRQ